MKTIQTGLDALVNSPPKRLFGMKIGLLCNHASVNRHFVHAKTLLHGLFHDNLTAIFSPQHGFFAEKQDNMIESEDTIDDALRIPIYSLYGKTRWPTQNMMNEIDVLIIDLQDVGTRVYTFIYSMSYCLEAAKRYGKKVIILDRPNPVNGVSVEGNILSADLTSFVGRFPIPMRHGLTMGELAVLFNDHYGIGCDLEILPMKGWNRAMYFHETGLPWVAPSPNMPTPTSAMVYPGQVIWEGTNVSEGRGTTQPFEILGAPFISPHRVLSTLNKEIMQIMPGVTLRPLAFEPTSNKHTDARCLGFQLHVTDPQTYRPYISSLALLQSILRCHGDQFQWASPPYEYDEVHLPIDLIIGDSKIREKLEAQISLGEIETTWQGELEAFKEIRQKVLQY